MGTYNLELTNEQIKKSVDAGLAAAQATGILKGTGSSVGLALAGVDYQSPLEEGVDYQSPLTPGDGISIVGNVISATGGSAVLQPYSSTVSLSEWDGNSKTIDVAGVTTDNLILVSPAPGSVQLWGKHGVRCTEQEDGKLTFTCVTAPETAVIVNIVVWR